MKIGIISAMPEEAQAILNHAENLKKSQHGERSVFYCGIAGHDITLIEAGMGMLNAGCCHCSRGSDA
jgi:nucleoside phosphorylase